MPHYNVVNHADAKQTAPVANLSKTSIFSKNKLKAIIQVT